MFAGLPSLSHEQQQKAVERIQELMSQGMSSGQAIALVAEELRASHTCSDYLNLNFVFRVHQSGLNGTTYRRVASNDPRVPGFVHGGKIVFVCQK